MEFEVNQITDTAAEDADRVADVAMGAAAEMADAVVHPLRTARKQVRRLEKRGEPILRKTERKLGKAAEETTEATSEFVSGALPERIALAGIRVIRSQARRNDMVGDVAYRALKLMNNSFEMALRTLNRFENASEPPAKPRAARSSSRRSASDSSGRRTSRRRPSSRTRATAAARRAQRSAQGRVTQTASRVRRATRRAATAARRSA